MITVCNVFDVLKPKPKSRSHASMKAKPAQLEVEDASGESGRKRRRSQNLDDDVKGQESAKSQKSGKGSARGDDDSPRSPRTPRSLTSPRYKGKELKGTSIPKSAKRVSSGSKVDFKDKNADPPRRVQKNPHFLQEHRDRYLDRTQSEGKFDQAPHKKSICRSRPCVCCFGLAIAPARLIP